MEWIDKARALGKELDVYKMEAVRLDKENLRLQKENNRLRMQFKSQEEDRDELVRQVLALKRETAKLRSDLDRRQSDSRPGTADASSALERNTFTLATSHTTCTLATSHTRHIRHI